MALSITHRLHANIHKENKLQIAAKHNLQISYSDVLSSEIGWKLLICPPDSFLTFCPGSGSCCLLTSGCCLTRPAGCYRQRGWRFRWLPGPKLGSRCCLRSVSPGRPGTGRQTGCLDMESNTKGFSPLSLV